MPKVSQTYKEDKRAQLIAAAERVFLRLGYAHTTIQDVLKEAGVSRGGLYLYFANKAELFEAVLDTYDQRFFGELERMRTDDAPIGPALLQLVNPSSHMDEQDRRLVAMVVEYHLEHRDDPLRQDRIFSRFDRVEGLLIDVLERGVVRGEFHPRLSLTTITRFLIGSQDGLAIHGAVQGSLRYDPQDYAEAITLFVHESLGF